MKSIECYIPKNSSNNVYLPSLIFFLEKYFFPLKNTANGVKRDAFLVRLLLNDINLFPYL